MSISNDDRKWKDDWDAAPIGRMYPIKGTPTTTTAVGAVFITDNYINKCPCGQDVVMAYHVTIEEGGTVDIRNVTSSQYMAVCPKCTNVFLNGSTPKANNCTQVTEQELDKALDELCKSKYVEL